ncbi:FKBP-type peptidyl-prolyl cis-trans isomerase [Adlercreutzia shanghongiae]|uniref:Peptidyl-prolyl cis-trans isomerase n=1 Tax=Adlercreutzia shanghongiae TaxID=3111773 RepID=A0ABU6IZ58_9ACTN|nr:FKBP-type peptidyl-prolyl cis-trans isomerase [Adlercreutzia sp. R22]MEC4294877.1 FKBP-type peptidyl-prolyl cis-trans isomerase [Adlercreutzia sp. R22]
MVKDAPRHKVTISYEGRIKGGEVFDRRDDSDPYEVIIGSAFVMKPIEEALAEMQPGETRTIEIACEDAYGPHDERRVKIIPAVQIAGSKDLAAGDSVIWRAPGETKGRPAKIIDRNDYSLQVDLNHPLAGKDLVYEVKLLEVLR